MNTKKYCIKLTYCNTRQNTVGILGIVLLHLLAAEEGGDDEAGHGQGVLLDGDGNNGRGRALQPDEG